MITMKSRKAEETGCTRQTPAATSMQAIVKLLHTNADPFIVNLFYDQKENKTIATGIITAEQQATRDHILLRGLCVSGAG